MQGAHIDEFDSRHLFREGRQHLVQQLTVAQDDLFRTSTLDKVLEVPREIVRAQERGQEVDVVRKLEDLGQEFDSVRNFRECEDHRDAIARLGIQLNHVQCACVHSRQPSVLRGEGQQNQSTAYQYRLCHTGAYH